MVRTKESRPHLIVSKTPFVLWDYEKGLISKGAVILFLFYSFWTLELVVFPLIKPGRLLPWVLAFFFVVPFLMLALGKLMPSGKELFHWNPGWRQTSHLRRWFRTQYSIGFTTLAIVSYVTGNLLCCVGFAILVPTFITYTWLIESKVMITQKGVATFSGVLNWADISEIRLFPHDKVIVLTVSNFGRFLIPYAIYHVNKPWKAKAAIESALNMGTKNSAEKV
jgi:hypothetical protein